MHPIAKIQQSYFSDAKENRQKTSILSFETSSVALQVEIDARFNEGDAERCIRRRASFKSKFSRFRSDDVSNMVISPQDHHQDSVRAHLVQTGETNGT